MYNNIFIITVNVSQQVKLNNQFQAHEGMKSFDSDIIFHRRIKHFEYILPIISKFSQFSELE